MGLINTLGYILDRDATRGRDVILTVDGRRLTDLLETAIPASSPVRRWEEKTDAKVVTQGLKASISRPGLYALLTCAHCKMPEDLTLKPIEVIHDSESIRWRIAPPGAGVHFEEGTVLELHFTRAQYESVIAKIMQREPSDG
jgi:hypothetical protein